jgi:major membrane immunogen (membrane-anchored lipoprotein)
MKNFSIYLAVAIIVLLTSCGTSNKIIIPTSKTLPSIDDNYTIVWVGSGKSYVFVDGEYVRSESNDYSFEVVQRRYGNNWKSIKNMHRIHPDYDGKAGPREQTMFFGVEFSKQADKIVSRISSSLGSGSGISDNEFREQVIQFYVDGTGSFAPYNTMRITQHYKYEQGALFETVELFKLKDDKEMPFVKIEERAMIFRAQKLENAPTKFE